MEDLYPAVKLEGKNKKMKPDLIFERDGNDHVLGFKVIWDGDKMKNSSKIKEG